MKKKRMHHPLWAIWHGMWQRCTNARRVDYRYYGQRGIIVCPAWKSLSLFVNDMGQCPSKQHTLDRIRNDGPYCPFNCRWATRMEQGQNTQAVLEIYHDGRTQSLSAWARELGMSASGLHRRWKAYGTIIKPVTLEERLRPHSIRLGLTIAALRRRIVVLGWPLKKALTQRKR